jgi:hypothetical protein
MEATSGNHLYVNAARRCSECHGRIHEQWASSVHAQASSSALYRELRVRAKQGECESCHAPLDRYVQPSHPVAGEGVTCDACHTVKDVTIDLRSSNVVRGLDDNTRYGTLADAKNHYFHRMGFSPMYDDARYCAGCHHAAHSIAPAGPDPIPPVFSEYEEWRAGPYGKLKKPCQRCHMPGEVAEIATGAGVRDRAPHHGLLGSTGNLRQRALRMTATVMRLKQDVRVEVSVQNARAGHAVPTGLPERRIVVEAKTVDGAGAVVGKAGASYGRHLVDADGRPAPFFSARRQAYDDRLAPKETRVERFTLAAPNDGALLIRVLWQSMDSEIAASVGVPEPAFEVLGQSRINLAAAAPARPESVELSP